MKAFVERMRREDPDFRVYSAGWHRYQFGPVLTEAAIDEFEAQHALKLPEDYRFFLTRIGNGGAAPEYLNIIGRNPGPGPGCGLFPLRETIRGSDVSKPFPLSQSTVDVPYDGTDAWDDTVPFPGALQICYRGGGSFSLLVVNGLQYGTVWDAEFDACPTQYHPTGLSFEEWYSRWLTALATRALPVLEREQLVNAVTLGMAKSQVVAILGDPSREWLWPDGRKQLSFPGFATSFDIDTDEQVTRIIRGHISINPPRE